MIIEELAKPTGELILYHDFALRMWMGQLPYKDFFPEYPPGALVFFYLAQFLGTTFFTLMWYLEIAIAISLITFTIWKLKGNFYIFLAMIFPLGGLLWDRFDIFPALLSILSIYLGIRKKFYWAFFILGMGVLTKVYPLFLLPILIYWQKDYFQKLLNSLCIFLLTIVIPLLIIISYGGSKGLIKFFEFQVKRGIAIESIRAMPILVKGKGIVEYKHNTFEIQ